MVASFIHISSFYFFDSFFFEKEKIVLARLLDLISLILETYMINNCPRDCPSGVIFFEMDPSY